MNRTLIEWVKNPDGSQGYTWNPITGCLNHDNGLCKGGGFPCYAYKLAHGRLKQRYLANNNIAMKPLGLEGALGYRYDQADFKDPFYPRFWEERMACQFSYSGKAQGIFVCDMSDLFGIGVPDNWTWQVLQLIKAYPQHRFYLLTKQPQNLIKFSPFPDNCWVGVTATSREMLDTAIAHLIAIEAKVKYISFEPLLDWRNFFFAGRFEQALKTASITWLIIGAQTKPYKPPEIEWVREIVEAADKAGIKVFLKDNLYLLLHSEPNFARDKLRVGTSGKLRQEMPSIPSE